MYCHRRDIFERGPGANPVATVVSYYSEDGLSFRRESGERMGTEPVEGHRSIGSAAPSVIRTPQGQWEMLITTVIEPRFPWNHLVFHTNSRHFERVEKAEQDRVRAEHDVQD